MERLRGVRRGLTLVLGLLLIAGGGLVGLYGEIMHAGDRAALGLVPFAIGLWLVIRATRGHREPAPRTAPGHLALSEGAP